MGESDQVAKQKNQGEGSTEAAKRYDDETRGFAESVGAPPAADDAKRAMEGPVAEALKRADAEGKRRGHGGDPQVKR